MDSILVVNAGSSSVKFEVFALDGSAKLTRKIKGQIDGIGTRPRFRASGADRTSLIDREYDTATISDVPAAMQSAGAWLQEDQRIPPSAVGHRVVHGVGRLRPRRAPLTSWPITAQLADFVETGGARNVNVRAEATPWPRLVSQRACHIWHTSRVPSARAQRCCERGDLW
jgi:hypothetical protein